MKTHITLLAAFQLPNAANVETYLNFLLLGVGFFLPFLSLLLVELSPIESLRSTDDWVLEIKTWGGGAPLVFGSFSRGHRDTTRREAGRRAGGLGTLSLSGPRRRTVGPAAWGKEFTGTAITQPGAAFLLLLGPASPALLGPATASSYC